MSERFVCENVGCKRSEKNILHVRAVMRVQRVPSMLSVCGVNVPYCPAER